MKLHGALERILEKYDLPLYGALFLAALLLRLAALETGPLSGKEAVEAWSALHLLRGESAASTSALFSSLTAGLLFITGPSHWTPRFFPALAGAFIVLLPMFFRSPRNRLEPFLAAILITLSPSLWIASTLAGGTTLGFLAAAFCIFSLRSGERHPLAGGIALGLAAASGPMGWSGLVIAAIVLLADWVRRVRVSSAAEGKPVSPFRTAFDRFLKPAGGSVGFIMGLSAGSTGLFFLPRGIGGLAAGFSAWLAAFFSGWPRVGEIILMLIAYEPAALVFGAAGIVLLWKGLLSEEDRFWGIFAAAAAVWVLIRPAAFPDEGLWMVLPLLILGARALRMVLESPLLEERPLAVGLQTGAMLVLAAFAIFNLVAYEASGSWVNLVLPLLLILGAFFAYLVYAGSWKHIFRQLLIGSAFALLGFFCLTQVGAGWNATHDRRASANELWGGSETTAADILRLHRTLVRISEWRTGVKDELAVVIEGPEDSALGWELLTYKAADYVSTADMFSAPAVFIAPYAEQDGAVVTPRLTAAYRGQAFAVAERRAWSGWPPDLIGWLLYREGPVERGRMILWVRLDVLIPEEVTSK